MNASVECIIRVSTPAAPSVDAWQRLSTVLPGDRRERDDTAYASASRSARCAPQSRPGRSFAVGKKDEDIEETVRRAVLALRSRKSLVDAVIPGALIECFICIGYETYVGLELPPDLSNDIVAAGVDLIVTR